MERRIVSSLALAASAAVVLIGLVVLVVLVRGESAVVSPELAAAAPSPSADASTQPSRPAPSGGERPSGGLAKGDLKAGAIAAATPHKKEPAAPALPSSGTGAEAPAPDPLDGQASEASDYYGRGDHESALEQAARVLEQKPSQSIREWMLRIASSSACFLGDADRARVYYDQLPPEGRPDVQKRCAKFGIEFR